MKVPGFASAASALRYWERRQEVASHNPASASTDGFEAERVFARVTDDALPVADTATDLRAGTLRSTGAPLDLALDGPGFFVVQTAGGERWSRGGGFRLDAAGQVVSASGHALLAEGGPVMVPDGGGTVAVDREGVVRVDGKEVARLRVETAPPGARLAHEAGTLFVPDACRAPADPAALQVRQGFLEESNPGTVGSPVDMISVQRAYAAVQKTMTTLDGVRQTISNEIGKPV